MVNLKNKTVLNHSFFSSKQTSPINFGLITEAALSVKNAGSVRSKSLGSSRLQTLHNVALTAMSKYEKDVKKLGFELIAEQPNDVEKVSLYKKGIDQPLATITNPHFLDSFNPQNGNDPAAVELYIVKDGKQHYQVEALVHSPSSKNKNVGISLSQGEAISLTTKKGKVGIELSGETKKITPLDNNFTPHTTANVSGTNFIMNAGGDGTRFLPLGINNKPGWPATKNSSIIGNTINMARKQGFDNFFIHTAHHADRQFIVNSIKSLIENSLEGNFSISEFFEPEMGTGTAIALARMSRGGASEKLIGPKITELEPLFNTDKESVVVMGDAHLEKMQLNDFVAQHRANKASVSIGLYKVDKSRAKDFGCVVTDNPGEGGKVVKFLEKSPWDDIKGDFKGSDKFTASTAMMVFAAEFYPVLDLMERMNASKDHLNYALDTNQVLDYGSDVLSVLPYLQSIQDQFDEKGEILSAEPKKQKKQLKSLLEEPDFKAIPTSSREKAKKAYNAAKNYFRHPDFQQWLSEGNKINLQGVVLDGYWNDIGYAAQYKESLVRVDSDLVDKVNQLIINPGGEEIAASDLQDYKLKVESGYPLYASLNGSISEQFAQTTFNTIA